MEHSLHLAAKHFVQMIAPASSKKRATEGADLDGEGASDSDDDDGDNDKDSQGFDSGDLLAKAIALVKQVSIPKYYQRMHCSNKCLQVRKSLQARAFFRATCVQLGIPPLELLLWIRTRWGSLFKFLERFLCLQVVCISLF